MQESDETLLTDGVVHKTTILSNHKYSVQIFHLQLASLHQGKLEKAIVHKIAAIQLK